MNVLGRKSTAVMQLYDTAAGEIVPFDPPPVVTMYTCGITPYDSTHIGHAATYLTYDVLQRRLRDLGHETRCVRNVTDADDDIFRKARSLGVHYLDLAAAEVARFNSDMESLGLLRCWSEPRATSAIADIRGFIGRVLDAGRAYLSDGAVYFDVESYPGFGELSGLATEEMLVLANERGGNPDDPSKRRPLDFVLWQPSLPDEPSWGSRWGPGRPGWHVECSTLAVRELGETIDLHGGGTDLIFPHHECERAQSEAATGKQFVRHWMHQAMVHRDGEKMSKSLGNLVFVSDLLKEFDPRAVRLALVGHHYRDPWEWTDEEVEAAAERLERWSRSAWGSGPIDDVREVLDRDLDTPAAVQVIDAAVGRGQGVGESALLLGVDLRAVGAAGGAAAGAPAGAEAGRSVSRFSGGVTTDTVAAMISVKLPDGSQRRLPDGATAADLAADIGPGLASRALIAVVDSAEVDLAASLPDGAEVQIITPESPRGLHTLRHSTAHVLAQAVLDLYPGATFAVGPPIADGFYYDFELPDGGTFSEDDLERIEARMKEIVQADQPFVREELGAAEALELFADHAYKQEIIEGVSAAASVASAASSAPAASASSTASAASSVVSASSAASSAAGGGPAGGSLGEFSAEAVEGEALSCYRNGDGFVDLCRGPHVPSTGRLRHFALQRVAGAYWRGDSRRPMLQRIYGTAWASKADLKAHLHMLAEAAKRDHRLLARQLDLVSWPDELGPGLAVWHPKGAMVRHVMEEYSRGRHLEGGYELVSTPHLAKAELWNTSGHLDYFAESMYPPMELDGATYYPKPMNCPFHVMIYKSRQRSYRDLPLRLFELGTVYRYELSGAVHGLLRSRGFTQDDSHIFAAVESVPEELVSLLEFVLSVLRAFGFEDFEAKLSTKPAGKATGSDDMWELATEGLRSALRSADLDYTTDEGGGAFYGPKIDVDVTDSLGRAWQLSTIQLDFNLPDRFDLTYTASDGERRRPVMIHRALFGSVERFFGVLLEHYAGAFPTWLAPVQACVLPVAEEHSSYAGEVAAALRAAGFRVRLGASDDPLGKRIRNAKLEKIPYVLVVGGDDAAAGTVGVNTREGKPERDVPIAVLLKQMHGDASPRR